MKTTTQIANRFQEVILDGTWIANTNLKAQLSDLGWEKATKKVGTFNTIAALTYHLDYYIAGILNVFEGGTLDIRDRYSFDLPPIISSEDWEKLKEKLWRDAEKFVFHVRIMPDKKLDEPFVDEKYGDYRRNIEGMIEHSYYHLGQIVLIRKML